MKYFKKLRQNIKQLLLPKRIPTVDTFETGGVVNIDNNIPNQKLDGKEAIFPTAIFSARLGQPRKINILQIREFARSPWVQMVLNVFKKQIESMEWDIVPKDEKDTTDYTEDIKTIKEKLNNINDNHQNISNVMSELITDLGEIDAGVYNLVYSMDSYVISDEVPEYDFRGYITEYKRGLLLKPLGQRTLTQVKAVAGDSFLKQIDLHKNILRYYQYTFRHPRANPTPFEQEEIEYLIMNSKSYSIYGFSPVQTLQQILEVLIQGTRFNKDLYKNSAIPAILIQLLKTDKEGLRKYKRQWDNEFEGKPHKTGLTGLPIDKVHKLASTNRDLEWLNGQQWYKKIVFGVFGVSPTEAGFFENANKSNDEGQARVTVRNALKPYMKKLENSTTNRIFPEILQKEETGLKFIFIAKDQVQEQIKFQQAMEELKNAVITINEYRNIKGQDPVAWGDEPYTGFSKQEGDESDSFSNTERDSNKDEKEEDSNKDKENSNKEKPMDSEKKEFDKKIKKARMDGFIAAKQGVEVI